ncbi:MAG: bifunctional diaminohydroxyphosphoribosylaminopyrimidine deaminase/5-amino-6-(5-phosphoribosylamino)uracil reductase RibD [Pseudomonadota bacterium]
MILSRDEDRRWMMAAIALAGRSRGRTAPNPNVGCVIVRDGRVIGRGITQAGGRPHAEAQALAMAGSVAGATAYVTLEPCAHVSERGPACADLLAAAAPGRVVIALTDPDPRTNGRGIARLEAAGIEVTAGVAADEARRSMAGFLTRQASARPHVTLKLATSLDGCIALADGRSQWITGSAARAHCHVERSRHEAILVGRGTFDADAPRLDVRLPGLADRSPKRLLLTHGAAPDDWTAIDRPEAIAALDGVDHLFVEGGAATAAAFLHSNLVDRLLIYTAPIVIGGGRPAIADIGLADLASAHGRWCMTDTRMLGSDRLTIYERS